MISNLLKMNVGFYVQVDVELEFNLDNKVEDHVYETVEDMDVFTNAQKLCSRGTNIEGTLRLDCILNYY